MSATYALPQTSHGAFTLQNVLRFKLAVTVAIWAGPMLFLPKSVFALLGFPIPEPFLFVRLLGAAYLALCVGYGSGVVELSRGRSAAGAVWMGVVSNGSAAMLVALAAMRGTFADWPGLAKAYMAVSGVLAAALAVALFLRRHDAPDI
ncbi:MAG: hypothetical protein H6684_03700 [Deltaproteobacteria bacterium]|nr:hypothetical protein [Deltaproteobacteria bacterium]MCB9487817.1 hypothetical protein [Deltaproteobacteria bacterium]